MRFVTPIFMIVMALGVDARAAPGDAPFERARASPSRLKKKALLLVILAGPKGKKQPIDVVELKRLLELLLRPGVVRVRLGPSMKAATFAEQVWQARAVGKRQNAMAVVWFRSLVRPGAGAGNEAELFMHLVDRLTNKALVKTLRLKGRVGSDLHKVVSLKLWTLLRASLLELQGTKRGRELAISRLVSKPSGTSSSQPTGAASLRKEYVPQPPEAVRALVDLGYSAGVFASGLAWHHGAWLALDVLLKRLPKAAVSLALGATVELLWPVEIYSQGIDLRLDLLPASLDFAAAWRPRAFALEGRLRAGALALKAGATVPGAAKRTLWRGNPFLGAAISVGWRPLKRLVLECRFTADALLRGQCFQTGTDDQLCVNRARFTLGLGLRIALP